MTDAKLPVKVKVESSSTNREDPAVRAIAPPPKPWLLMKDAVILAENTALPEIMYKAEPVLFSKQTEFLNTTLVYVTMKVPRPKLLSLAKSVSIQS